MAVLLIVKVARMTKAKDQLKGDIGGLNIALEAKQQEVMLLKRETHRQSSEFSSTSRPVRTLRSRPLSIRDTEKRGSGAGFKTAASGSVHINRSRPTSRRISFAGNFEDGSSNTTRALPNSAAATSPKSNLKVSAAKPNPIPYYKSSSTTAATNKALEAAMLVHKDGSDKENSPQPSAKYKSGKLVELPNTPQHLISSREQFGKRRMSVISMHA